MLRNQLCYTEKEHVVNTNPLFFSVDNETVGHLAGIKHAFSGNLIFKYFLLQKLKVVMVVISAIALSFVKYVCEQTISETLEEQVSN